jgi:hypothetical protein
MSRGFKGFRRPETISEDARKAAKARYGESGRFIYWTGEAYNARRESLRSNSLKALAVSKAPVPLADWIDLAAKVVDSELGIGYDPASVRAGLYLHRGSKPAVYFELKRRDDGAYVSANEVPYAQGYPKGLKTGDVVIPAEAKADPVKLERAGGKLIAAPKAPKAPKLPKGKALAV